LCALNKQQNDKLKTQMNIGEKIFRFRMAKKLSQDHLADALNVSKSAIRKWEQNQTVPKGKNLANLCVYFNVTFEEFMSTNHEKPEPAMSKDKVSVSADATKTKRKSAKKTDVSIEQFLKRLDALEKSSEQKLEDLREEYELRLKEKDETITMLRGMLGGSEK
jgi:transcriptional regulator with XRE-family HTH domain